MFDDLFLLECDFSFCLGRYKDMIGVWFLFVDLNLCKCVVERMYLFVLVMVVLCIG